MATAVLIAFALVTLLTGASYGALETVKSKAARYFAGHVSVTGYHERSPGISDPEAVMESLRGSGLPIRTMARRTVYYREDSRLLFGGDSLRLRRMIGVDFDAERSEFAEMSFAAGGFEPMLGAEGQNGVLISEVAADLLGARVGDSVALELTTDSGQYNTANLIVQGIFQESSIFGYVMYVRLQDLNRLLQRPADSATDIAVYAEQGVNRDHFAQNVRNVLAQAHRVFPPIESSAQLTRQLDRGTPQETLAVLSLSAHLAEITEILDAVLAVTYFVLAFFMLIVMVGILNTYRVLVYERTREIGTMRALGMGRGGVQRLFLFEAGGLGVIASAAGLLLGIALLALLSTMDLGALPASGLFTDQGFLSPYLNVRIIGLNAIIIVAAVVLAAIGPAYRAARLDPAEALRRE